MKLLIKKLYTNAKVPFYAHDNDSGMDLFSIENCKIQPGEFKLIRTGIAISLPHNTEAQVRPRSGLALNSGITVLNTPGTIDEGYRGEVGVILINHGHSTFDVEIGMKIAQMVVKPVIHVEIEEVSKLEKTERSIGGFGSTGIK